MDISDDASTVFAGMFMMSIMFYNGKNWVELFDCIRDENIIKKYIDDFIGCSIQYEHPEITIFLLDYKYKHHLFTEKNWEI